MHMGFNATNKTEVEIKFPVLSVLSLAILILVILNYDTVIADTIA